MPSTRKLFMWAHLLVAAFIAPFIVLAATSGGLYLLGVKGSAQQTEINLPSGAALDFQSPTLKNDVQSLLKELNLNDDFEYIKNRGNIIQTRPTSKAHYEFAQSGRGLTLKSVKPDFQKSMIELHKGHGPLAFKLYQKMVAISLILVILTGVYLGLANPKMRTKTVLTLLLGTALFAVLAFI